MLDSSEPVCHRNDQLVNSIDGLLGSNISEAKNNRSRISYITVVTTLIAEQKLTGIGLVVHNTPEFFSNK